MVIGAICDIGIRDFDFLCVPVVQPCFLLATLKWNLLLFPENDDLVVGVIPDIDIARGIQGDCVGLG